METVSLDAKSIPMVHSEDVESLISDSGITRFRLNAKIWDVLSKGDSTYWHFPKGIYVEKFDSLLDVEASVTADTAYYWDKKKLWKLIGNVKIKNLKQEKFETSEMFWDQKNKTVYSDSLVWIERENGLFVALGFRSNESMTKYTFYKMQPGYMYLENVPKDSLQ